MRVIQHLISSVHLNGGDLKLWFWLTELSSHQSGFNYYFVTDCHFRFKVLNITKGLVNEIFVTSRYQLMINFFMYNCAQTKSINLRSTFHNTTLLKFQIAVGKTLVTTQLHNVFCNQKLLSSTVRISFVERSMLVRDWLCDS